MSTRIIVSLWLVTAIFPVSMEASAEKSHIVGVDVNKLIYHALGEKIIPVRQSVGRRGVSYMLMKNSESVGTIMIGIFSDRKSAIEIFEEHLEYTSMGPDKNLSEELGNQAFSWGMRRILFARDNAVVSVVLPKDLCLNVSKAIDRLLVEGAQGVAKDAIIHMPRILKVQAQEELLAGTQVDIKVYVAVPEVMNDDSLGFVDQKGAEITSGVPIIDKKREVEIVRTLRYRVPVIVGKPETVGFEICYATRGCVIASKKITLDDIIQRK
jgi:hypothetical protein